MGTCWNNLLSGSVVPEKPEDTPSNLTLENFKYNYASKTVIDMGKLPFFSCLLNFIGIPFPSYQTMLCYQFLYWNPLSSLDIKVSIWFKKIFVCPLAAFTPSSLFLIHCFEGFALIFFFSSRFWAAWVRQQGQAAGAHACELSLVPWRMGCAFPTCAPPEYSRNGAHAEISK